MEEDVATVLAPEATLRFLALDSGVGGSFLESDSIAMQVKDVGADLFGHNAQTPNIDHYLN